MVKRLLLIGSNQVSSAILDEVSTHSSVKVCGVLTAPRSFRISYSKTKVVNVNYGCLAEKCMNMKISSHTMHGKMNSSDVIDFIDGANPDIILVAGWHHMIPRNIYEQYLTLGLHASLLPRYRGGAPLVWALINGEVQTGVSLFRIGEGVDAGVVLDQVRFDIEPLDTINDLLLKAESASKKLVVDLLPNLERLSAGLGDVSGIDKFPIWPQRSPEDGNVKMLGTPYAIQLQNFIRAQTRPYPGAFVAIGNETVKLWQSGKIESRSSICVSGLHSHDTALYFGCTDSCLEIREWERFESQ